jgi:hypothetical protein
VSTPQHTPGPLSVKVERTCPRCRTRAYQRGNDRGIADRIACVNCGHEWTGRIRKDEQRLPSGGAPSSLSATDADWSEPLPYDPITGLRRTGVGDATHARLAAITKATDESKGTQQ